MTGFGGSGYFLYGTQGSQPIGDDRICETDRDYPDH